MTRNRHATFLGRMFVLSVTSFLGYLAPSIRFDPLDDVPNFHAFAFFGAAFFRLEAGRFAT
jgi:hypothetical protein